MLGLLQRGRREGDLGWNAALSAVALQIDTRLRTPHPTPEEP